jgi:hypothetical protein
MIKQIFIYLTIFLIGFGSSFVLVGNLYQITLKQSVFQNRHLLNFVVSGATEFQNGRDDEANAIFTFIIRHHLNKVADNDFIALFTNENPQLWVEHRAKLEQYLLQYPAADCAHVKKESIIDCHKDSSKYNES